MPPYVGKKNLIKILDGTAGTPQSVDVLGETTPSFAGAFGRALPEEVPKLQRGNLSGSVGRAVVDDTAVVTPIPISLTLELSEENFVNAIPALSNPFQASPWTVGSGTFVPVDQSTMQIPDSEGVLQAFPPFQNALYNTLVIVEFKMVQTVSVVMRYEGVFFPADQLTYSETISEVPLVINGLAFGQVSPLADFTATTDITL